MIFFNGILLGFLMSVPIGPVGILTIERTVRKGRASGLLTGFGSAMADGLYASVAVFGITLVSSFISEHALAIRLIGGLVVLGLGADYLFGTVHDSWRLALLTHLKLSGRVGDFLTGFLLTLTNPSVIVSFGVLFALFNFSVAGIIIGSMLWFMTLSYGITYLNKHREVLSVATIRKFAGVLTIIFALVILGGFGTSSYL